MGAFLQLLGFIIVGAIALFAKRRTVVIRQRLEDQKIVSNPVAPGDEW